MQPHHNEFNESKYASVIYAYNLSLLTMAAYPEFWIEQFEFIHHICAELSFIHVII